MNTSTNPRIKAQLRATVCHCGQAYKRVPEEAKFFIDPELGGYYWNCTCGTTHFSPCPEELGTLPHHGMCKHCGGTWNTIKPTRYCPHCEKEAA
jgi:hypothetical protein